MVFLLPQAIEKKPINSISKRSILTGFTIVFLDKINHSILVKNEKFTLSYSIFNLSMGF
jgi:hypothetical protein